LARNGEIAEPCPVPLSLTVTIRPGRGQHNALDALCVGITAKRVNYIFDGDVQSLAAALACGSCQGSQGLGKKHLAGAVEGSADVDDVCVKPSPVCLPPAWPSRAPRRAVGARGDDPNNKEPLSGLETVWPPLAKAGQEIRPVLIRKHRDDCQIHAKLVVFGSTSENREIGT
jgi:hypothetical protein